MLKLYYTAFHQHCALLSTKISKLLKCLYSLECKFNCLITDCND